MNYLIVICQIINVPVHEPFFYWMILCLIFAKGNFRTIPGIIVVLHWALYSIATMIDQIRYFYIAANKTIDRENQWKKYDTLIILLNYLSEIAGDWYPVYVIYKYVPRNFLKKLSSSFCLFYNITKLLPVVHFYYNYDNCNTFITYKVVQKCLHTDFWVTWSNLQCIISIGTFIYYLLLLVILNKATYPVSRNILNYQSIIKKFRNYSPYRIKILCLIAILSSVSVIPLPFHARNRITFNFELLRTLLKNISYYIIYFDRILLENFGDPRDSMSNSQKNQNIYRNLKENRIFKEDPLSVTKPSNLFISSNMESNSNTYSSYLKSKSPEYFMYSRGESSNTNLEDDPTISNNIRSTLKINVNRLGSVESNSNNIELFKGSPNYYYSPYDTPLGSPKKGLSIFDYPILSPKGLNSPGSKSPFSANIYSDKARLNSDFDDFDDDVALPLKNDIIRIGSGNSNGNGRSNDKNKKNIENISSTGSTIPSTLTLPPFRTERENNNNNSNTIFTEYSQDDATSFSQYSKNSLTHRRGQPSKGSFFFNSGKENDSFGVNNNRSSLTHQRTLSKGSSFFSTPKMQQVSTRSVSKILINNIFIQIYTVLYIILYLNIINHKHKNTPRIL
ncbi:hypothetical protein LY90DRAFT_663883 [Neocallimastix californiae]|uniref:Uncharacterized protein n=1 Tax=Neocallimastix californiae TaxID=1754190 RepID=A0A1Y2FHP3_9FUNG|nr:hypothetical protein LY90DRAFT_663883 [Neocallimastix californiae]|eukprot:ORY83459.1 hypothetical protein LY90DRAFT_663883 [Neocallimastix californiae]